jgi:transcriptional regulator with XRE-family HTH domain
MDRARAGFGDRLKQWRQRRGLTQMSLALDAAVSTRHLSWLENGRANPSRAMVLKLAARLDLPLRERNAMLVAAGYAPLYAERPLADPALATARAALQRLLDAFEPSPALAVDRHWQLIAHNRLVPPFLALVAERSPLLVRPPINVLRLSLHPAGLAPMIENLIAWRSYVLARLQRQVAVTDDGELARLLAELRALPPPDGAPAWSAADATEEDKEGSGGDDVGAAPPDMAVPLTLSTPHGRLSFITTLTVFGAPRDVTLAEIAIESLLPADEATAATLRQIHASVACAGQTTPALPNP